MAEGRRRELWDHTSYLWHAVQGLIWTVQSMMRGEDDQPLEQPKLFEVHPLRDTIEPEEQQQANDPNLTLMAAVAMLPPDQQVAAFKSIVESIRK